MLWRPRVEADEFVTLYKGEDIHPLIGDAFDWYEENVAALDVNESPKPILAGGALRSYFTNTSVRDFDLYFPREADLVSFHSKLSRNGFTSRQAPKSLIVERAKIIPSNDDRAARLDYKTYNLIQYRYPKKPEDVIRDFDFTICMCAINREQITYHPDFFLDLQGKLLRVYNPEDPIASLWRMQKYVRLGYTMDRENLWKLIEGVNNLDSLPQIKDEALPDSEGKALHQIMGAS